MLGVLAARTIGCPEISRRDSSQERGNVRVDATRPPNRRRANDLPDTLATSTSQATEIVVEGRELTKIYGSGDADGATPCAASRSSSRAASSRPSWARRAPASRR